MEGLLPIDKPRGPTSFDVVRAVRRAANIRRVGHAGTLDPLAEGLLLICLGRATRLVELLMGGEKIYRARIALGRQTETDDAQGETLAEADVPPLGEKSVRAALARFTGEIEQVPPAYSALKQEGVPQYRRARRGERVEPRPRKVRIDAIELERLGERELELTVRCGRGTYIRSLARDLGIALGTRAHLAALRRTHGSGFDVEEALPLARLDEPGFDLGSRVVPLGEALRGRPRAVLGREEARRVRDGQRIEPPGGLEETAQGPLVLLDDRGELVAVAEQREGRLAPLKVFR
ncbi:MAG: tRNA pseudouridine(55) synthase TruB [Polyangia bacterium]